MNEKKKQKPSKWSNKRHTHAYAYHTQPPWKSSEEKKDKDNFFHVYSDLKIHWSVKIIRANVKEPKQEQKYDEKKPNHWFVIIMWESKDKQKNGKLNRS